jgi:hypothetical protein
MLEFIKKRLPHFNLLSKLCNCDIMDEITRIILRIEHESVLLVYQSFHKSSYVHFSLGLKSTKTYL